MKRRSLLALTCTTTLLMGGAALADCQSELQEMTTSSDSGSSTGNAKPQGISKSGELAPLEQPGEESGTTTTSQDQSPVENGAQEQDGGIAKDGSMSPLNSAADTPGLATSQQEAETQQQPGGEPEAGGRAAAIEAARNALDSGDEEACMEALERARDL